MKSTLREELERQDGALDNGPKPTLTPVRLTLAEKRQLDRPIDLLRFLVGAGLRLSEAHGVLNDLAGASAAKTYLSLKGLHTQELEKLGVRVIALERGRKTPVRAYQAMRVPPER